MKKILGLLMAIILFSFSLDAFYESKAEAATVGQQLLQPEEGWQRFDDTHPFIKYTGSGWKVTKNASHYNGTHGATPNLSDTIMFSFQGTKLRVISYTSSGMPSNLSITIDGKTEYFSEDGSKHFNVLVFEKLGLEDITHSVEIRGISSGNEWANGIDAIDIDSEGDLIDPDNKIVNSIKLNKETLDLTVGSSESLIATITPENATNKVIQWTSSDPEIASVDSNGNVIGKKTGKVTITATTTDGSNLSASVEVTVKEAEIDANRAILRLTTTTKDIHEYDLSRTEIEQFMSWLDGREVGQGKPYYKFKLNVTTGNIVSRTEYIMYDKIVSFTVDEYK